MKSVKEIIMERGGKKKGGVFIPRSVVRAFYKNPSLISHINRTHNDFRIFLDYHLGSVDIEGDTTVVAYCDIGRREWM